MEKEPWKGTHFLSPFPPGLAVIGCGRLPAHSLPCASTALLASKMRDGAKSPPLLFHLLPRGAASLAASFPVPGIPHVGLAAPGKPGSGTPAVCYHAAVFQLATLWPHMGAPNSFLAKAAGKTSEVWVFRLRGLSYLTAKGIHVSFPIPTSVLTSLCSSSGFSAIPVPEDGAAKPVRVPVELMWLFCFFLFIICIPAGSEGPRQGKGLFLSVLLVRPLNQ